MKEYITEEYFKKIHKSKHFIVAGINPLEDINNEYNKKIINKMKLGFLGTFFGKEIWSNQILRGYNK
jgi:hypothetical protein